MRILWLLTVSTILTTIGIWIIVFKISDIQKPLVVEMEGTFTTTEQIFAEETETLPIETYEEKNVVCLYWNLPAMENDLCGTEKAMHLTYGDPIPESPNIEGYVFCGWNTEPAGDGEDYQLGSSLELRWEGELVLYGQWKQVDPDEEENDDIDGKESPGNTESTNIEE